MIFRITDYVHYGTLDNRKRGTVHLTLQLMGMPHPVNITLHGDCLQDLAGCVVDFRNPSPQMLPAELTQIPEHIQGVAGDMTASRRMPVKGKKTMENALYLEWFTSHHDMVLLESTVFSIKVSLPEWMMDSCEEQAQIMANQQMLRTQVKEWSRAYSNHQEDGSLPDHHWDKRLREAEAIAIAYQEVFQKYRLNPSGDIRVAFVMGWDEVLDNIAQSEETGTPCSCKSTGMLSLFDILNEQEAREVQSCMFHPLFQQVMELTDLCQHRFSREINKAQRNRTGPPEPLNQIFYCIRYITPRILSCLLQEKEDAADYCTMAARMALCVEQTRRTVAALDNCCYQMDGEIAERFSSLLEEVNSFQESLATQSRKSNL